MRRDELLARLRAMKPWLESQGVSRLRVFGSHARDEAGPESDVDLLVEFASGREPDLFSYSGLRLELEKRLGLKVDLLTPSSVHPSIMPRLSGALVDA